MRRRSARRAAAASAWLPWLGARGEGAAWCPPRFQVPAAAPRRATDLNGLEATAGCFNREGAEAYHVFAIGDWGGVQLAPGGPPVPADHRSAHFPLHARRFVVGVDDAAQLRVAARMKERANVSRPDYVLNAGDNFYWGGITTHCGQPASEHVATGQWRGVFEDVYTAPGLEGQWLGVLGNHDYGGYIFSAGWDQVIGYTWRGPASSGRWLTPAQYWSTTAHYPGFSVDYFFVDTNVFLALNPDTDPDHNICSLKHNAEGPHMPDTCGSQGPKSTWDCPGWFGGLWAAQIEWLDGKLATSAAEWQIVVTHFPPTFGREEWSYLAERHGIDLMVTGHKHQQEVHYLEPPMNLTAWIVSGGGGGITSEGVPDVDGNDDMYGFFDLSLTPAEIVVEAISHSGVVRSRTRVARRYPCPACYQVPTYTKTTVTAVTSTRTSTSQTSTLSGTSTGTSAVTSTVTNTGTSTAIASADAPEARSSIFASLLAAALFGDADQDATAGRAGTLDDPLVVA